jgi:hypothetical protein
MRGVIMFKFLIYLLLCVISLSSAVASDWLSKQMFSLNPSVRIEGPKVGTLSTKEYNSQVLRLILEEGHELSREYLMAEDHKAYWAFLITAITVPFHEGGNIHFRVYENDGKTCHEKANSGDIFKSNQHYYSAFQRIFKNSSQIIPNCSDLDQEQDLNQFIHGADGSDLGIMQVNIRWHERDYLAVGDWTSVRKSIRYGLRILKKGFDSVYRNSNSYSCVNDSNGKLNYQSIIRGVWAGLYNSGNLKSTCRFTDSANAWAGNDKKFKLHLETILSLSEKENRNKHYSLPALEDSILEKVVQGFNSSSQKADFLIEYLSKDSAVNLESSDTTLRNSKRTSVKKEASSSPAPILVETSEKYEKPRTYEVNASALNFRDDPSLRGTHCGAIPHSTQVVVVGRQGDWLELRRDSNLISLEKSSNACKNDVRFAHKNFLSDLGSLSDVIPEKQNVVEEKKTNSKNVTSSEEIRFPGKVTKWVTVREDRPSGGKLAPPTGKYLGPDESVIIAEKFYSAPKNLWYRITSPVQGWVYSEMVEIHVVFR